MFAAIASAIAAQHRRPVAPPPAPSGLTITDQSVVDGACPNWDPKALGSWNAPPAGLTSVKTQWECPTGTPDGNYTLAANASSQAWAASVRPITALSKSVKLTVTFTNSAGSSSASVSATLMAPC